MTKILFATAALTAVAGAVCMTRDPGEHPDSHEAHVALDQVADWEARGWAVAVEGDPALMSREAIIEALIAIGRAKMAEASTEELLRALRLARGEAGQEQEPALFGGQDDDPPLYGSSILPAIIEIGGLNYQLGALVVESHKESGLSVTAWNDLPEADREARLSATLERLRADPAALGDMVAVSPAPEPASTDAPPERGVIEIPVDWSDLQWTRRVQLAKLLTGAAQMTAAEADAAITAELRSRELDAPQEAAGGLTLRELHADLESLKVEFDPAADAATLFALRNEARDAKA